MDQYHSNLANYGHPNLNHGNGNDKIVLAEGYLPTNQIIKIDKYLRWYGFLSQSIDDYIQGDVRGKLKNPSRRLYSYLVLTLFWVIAFRNILLTFNNDTTLRTILGEPQAGRPYDQIIMTLTFWSLYMGFVCRLFYNGEKNQKLSWLTPFAIFKGLISPGSMGLDVQMTSKWFNLTKYKLFKLLWISRIQALFCVFGFGILAYRRNNSHAMPIVINLFWTVLQSLWAYFGIAIIFISYAYFYSLAIYFKMRFRKVNNNIEALIAPGNRIRPNERCTMLYHILVEHNKICVEIHEYNKFWSKFIMATYFLYVAIICYTIFQAFFTFNLFTVRIIMIGMTVQASYLITKISMVASNMSDEAHLSYGRLIRVTFNKYPIELQIQLRMFIQRLSGPTIGFYCLDIFEITYSTYASIIAALGQNFLLVIDFVRSYGQIKDGRYTSTDLDLSDVVNSTFGLMNKEIEILQEKLL